MQAVVETGPKPPPGSAVSLQLTARVGSGRRGGLRRPAGSSAAAHRPGTAKAVVTVIASTVPGALVPVPMAVVEEMKPTHCWPGPEGACASSPAT